MDYIKPKCRNDEDWADGKIYFDKHKKYKYEKTRFKHFKMYIHMEHTKRTLLIYWMIFQKVTTLLINQ